MSEDLKRFLAVFGPAWLVMMADVDVASIIEGLEAGAIWGIVMSAVMLLLTLPLYFIQDAAGTLGTLGGLGLGEAIRIKYGRRIAAALSVPMAVTDFLEYIAEYAGIAVGFRLLGLPVAFGVLLAFAIHLYVVLGRHYRETEAMLLPISFVMLVAIVLTLIYSGFRINLTIAPVSVNQSSFFFVMAANIGAVIMPWMLFFHSGADSRKGLKGHDLKYERLETALGALASEVLMAIVVIDGATLGSGSFEGILSSILGLPALLRLLFAVGFLSSGFLALVVISMASGWGVAEALNLSSKQFYIIYALESFPAVIIVILVSNYLAIILNLMVIYSVLLIPLLLVLGQVVSDKKLMNGNALCRRKLLVYWLFTAVISCFGIAGILSGVVGPFFR